MGLGLEGFGQYTGILKTAEGFPSDYFQGVPLRAPFKGTIKGTLGTVKGAFKGTLSGYH